MQTKIQKWGNSLGLRIPRSFAAEAQVEEGSTVDLSVENGRLLVRPLRARKYALSELLKKVNPRNVHGEVPTGKPLGREGWGSLPWSTRKDP
jgi:antitoxin MazE